MAPSFDTQITRHESTASWDLGGYIYIIPVKKETKKQKIARIAKEKMYASWKTFNDKGRNIIQVKQICKPRHMAFNSKHK